MCASPSPNFSPFFAGLGLGLSQSDLDLRRLQSIRPDLRVFQKNSPQTSNQRARRACLHSSYKQPSLQGKVHSLSRSPQSQPEISPHNYWASREKRHPGCAKVRRPSKFSPQSCLLDRLHPIKMLSHSLSSVYWPLFPHTACKLMLRCNYSLLR